MTIMSGRRFVLRDMQQEDLAVFSQWMQPGREWQRFDGPYYTKATTEEVAAQVTRLEARIAAGEWPPLREQLAIANKVTDAIVGMVSRYWISQETNWTAIGIAVWDPENWNKRIGYEALGLWCAYLFNAEPDFVRLDMRTWSGNLRMMRLAKKLGFMLEARFRKARIVEGRYYDGLGYGVLREEWDARYPQGFVASLPPE
ncbi:MAG: GNAT family N-acetyltransferase [Chloroflexota bacterium]